MDEASRIDLDALCQSSQFIGCDRRNPPNYLPSQENGNIHPKIYPGKYCRPGYCSDFVIVLPLVIWLGFGFRVMES